MVKKIIACADIHFRNLEGLNELQESLKKFIEKCKEIIEQEGGPEFVRIVVCGDIVQSKITISNECILAVGWFFRELNTLAKTIIVGGNHDTVLSNLQRVDSLTPFFQIGDFENIVYIDGELDYSSGCLEDDNIVWCLYSMFSSFNRPEKIEELKTRYPDKTFVGLIHGDINGAVNFIGRATENGLDAGLFEGLDFVIAGHIHKFQEIKKNGVKIVYCSSITQKDYGETLTGHGFVLWDVENNTYEFVEIPNPDGGYYKFALNSIEDLEKNKEELLNL